MTPAQLKSARERLGLTQAEFANRLGVTRDAVASWETGRAPISKLVALAVKHLTCK